MIIFAPFVQPVSNSTFTVSGPIHVSDYGNFFIGLTISGSDVVGTATLEASATENFARFWTVTGSSQAVTASSDPYWNISDVSYNYVRVRWTNTSGTGNITVDATMRQPFIQRGA